MKKITLMLILVAATVLIVGCSNPDSAKAEMKEISAGSEEVPTNAKLIPGEGVERYEYIYKVEYGITPLKLLDLIAKTKNSKERELFWEKGRELRLFDKIEVYLDEKKSIDIIEEEFPEENMTIEFVKMKMLNVEDPSLERSPMMDEWYYIDTEILQKKDVFRKLK